jgi:hypothetical protein
MNAAAALQPTSSVVPAFRFKVEQARVEFAGLESWMFSEEALNLPLDEIEREQERRSREVNRLLLQAHVQAREKGDVGPALTVVSPGAENVVRLHTHRREQVRHATTVFGEVEVSRLGYGAEGAASIHPLDEVLALPERTYSYEVQRRLAKAAVQGPFDEAVERVEEATGTVVPKRSAEEVVKDAARDFDAFYAERRVPKPEETGPIVAGAIDGKGVPMVKPEQALRVVRRGKGKKANKKRMATVAAVFTQEPRVRTPEEVVESLFRTGPQVVGGKDRPARTCPEHKRVWASIEKSKDEVITEAGAEMARRDPEGTKTHVALTDGERALQMRVLALLPGVLLVLDLLHVMEYLWKAAYCFHPEGSPEAAEWVKARALRILKGKVSQVVKGLRQSVTKRRMRGPKRKVLLGVARYFYRNRSRMRYDGYLAAGLPIASGAVEGACRNLIKDRMERSGMRWTIAGAEAMLRLRACYLSEDFEEYWPFHVRKDQERLHPAGRWQPAGGVVGE